MAFIGIGSLGMGASQIILHLEHPGCMGNDFFHGLLLGAAIALELIGIQIIFNEEIGLQSSRIPVSLGDESQIVIAS